jgi:hypothetical protein
VRAFGDTVTRAGSAATSDDSAGMNAVMRNEIATKTRVRGFM